MPSVFSLFFEKLAENRSACGFPQALLKSLDIKIQY